MSLIAELKRRNVIRVVAAYVVLSWLLLQIGDVTFDFLEVPDWAGKLLIAFLALGFIPAILFSWAYEITPEGIKKESEVDRSQSVTAQTGRKLDYITIVLLVVAVGLLGVDRLVFERGEDAVPTPQVVAADVVALALGIAVLPFDNLSEDASNAFFASGVHEDVLTHLTRVADLRVISRTSMLRVAEMGLEVPAIGEHLGVSHVLEGSVRRAGDRVRITVQLIDTTTNSHVWAENYDRTLDDIFAIQTEIAQAIVARLEAVLTPDEAASLADFPTTSIEAYDAYLRARERWNTVDTGSPDYAGIIEPLLRATELDPDFIEAWLLVVEVGSLANWFTIEVDLNRTRASDALARIRALAPDSPETNLATGIYLYWVEYDLEQALAALERAVAARPNDPKALEFLAWVGRRLQRWDTAVAAARHGVQVDPANSAAHNVLIAILADRLDLPAAIGAAAEAARRFPESVAFRVSHAELIYRHTGNVAPFKEMIDDVPPSDRLGIWNAPLIQGVFDDTEDVIAWFDAVDRDENPQFSYQSNFVIGNYVLVHGDRERAQPIFEESYSAFIGLTDGVDDAGRQQWLAFRGWSAALVGDSEAAMEYRERGLAYAAASNDILAANGSRLAAAMVLAILGDAEAAWREFEPLVGVPGGVTRWDLALSMHFRYFLADFEGYQAMLAELEADE